MASSALKLPGVAGQYASAPDSAALSITSDVDIRALVAADDWTPAAGSTVVAKWNSTGNQKSYMLQILADGTLRLGLSNLGSDNNFGVSSVANGFVDGSKKWIRGTWRNSDNRVQFFTCDGSIASPTSSDWVQLGTDQSINLTGLKDSTALLEVGANSAGTGTPFAGLVYRAQVRNNVLDDGTGIQFDADFSAVSVSGMRAPGTFTEGSSNAATVTVNGAAAWFWSTWSPSLLSLPGVSGQYPSAPDSVPLSIVGDLTLLVRVALDDWTPGAFQSLVGKWNNAAKSYNLGVSNNAPAGKLQLSISTDGSTTVAAVSTVAPTVSDGSALWVLASRRKSDGRVQFFTASGSIASPAASDFTQLGADVTGISAGTNLFDSTTVVEVGSLNVGTASMASGKFYRAMIYDGVFSTAAFGGTKQFDSNFTGVTVTGSRTPASFAEGSANAATVTLNGTAAWEWQRYIDHTRATESDTARPASTTKSATITKTAETDTGRPATVSKSASITKGTETDAGRPCTVSKSASITKSAETDAGRPTSTTKSATITKTTENDAGRPGTVSKSASITKTAETDAGRPPSTTKSATITKTAETDTGRPASTTKSATITKTAEIDTGRPASTIKSATVTRCAEGDSGRPLTVTKPAEIIHVDETDTSEPVAAPKTPDLAHANEADTGQQQTASKLADVAHAAETETARPQTHLKASALAAALEIHTGRPVSTSKSLLLAHTVETDNGRSFTVMQAATIASIVESDTARAPTTSKSVPLDLAAELDTVLRLHRLGGRDRDIVLIAGILNRRHRTGVFSPAHDATGLQRVHDIDPLHVDDTAGPAQRSHHAESLTR